MVLIPATPVARKSTQFKLKPFTVMVDEVTLSPAKPAAREKSRRKPIQWAGVYQLKISFCVFASAVPSFWHVHWAPEDCCVQAYSPEAFATRCTGAVSPVPPVGVR